MRTFLATCAIGAAAMAAPAAAQTVYVNQGSDWTPSLRQQFYTQDQGARIMPIAWMRALTLPDGEAFLHDALARYGYLPMAGRQQADLPAGFTTNGTGTDMAVGMSCAACHTRQIEVSGTAYRIDGGPGIVDFQSFLKDLDDAVLAVLATDDAFDAFADRVLGSGADPAAEAALRAEVEVWSKRFHTLIDRSLPDPAWAPARLDAISMIFNRLAGLDIGEAVDDYLIPDNIAVADAPARYPFLWNAARQDYTQWPGFAANGNDLLGLSRNLGEVYGVFGEFHPQPKTGGLFNRDFISVNSANWEGLSELEKWIWDIGAPQWPWELDQTLAAQGETVFNRDTADGGCVECHGKKKGKFRSIFHTTYATPVLDVGTDTRECGVLARSVKTGVLDGASIPLTGTTLGAEASAFDVLAVSVVGAIVQHGLSGADKDFMALAKAAGDTPSAEDDHEVLERFSDLRKAFPTGDRAGLLKSMTDAESCKYEARVLAGIWAAAPYLHNGSVPTLTALLTAPADRPASFKPGPNYDIEAVGMAAEQSAFDQVIETTGCDQLDSGNSRCGHDYGTSLSEADKKALLEYLKSI
ncbi:di-heme-cytochrome C peroxidase [Leisingera sp. SS27]|uniref:di-heme-cytochrome C peroxidase n=1 Tax=Leisingera sp. SS27 TaxID=2979462 RepID=UPI00232FAFB3|nr:di-heme-cytochrome C peroxidase [Leisingera sp. SS27]MDC0657712.1 di-heme-cytochrome C peroxidase [Leisingera sp. SS27]